MTYQQQHQLADDALATADVSTRPHSIDLSIQLERSLDLENDHEHDDNTDTDNTDDNNTNTNDPSHTHTPLTSLSLDPDVLASIITQLRTSLTGLTRERDTLSEALSSARAHEAHLQDALQHVSDKCVKLEGDLSAALDKNKEDEEAIMMLRSKVEESR